MSLLALQTVAVPIEKAPRQQLQFKRSAAALPAQAVQFLRARLRTPPRLSHARFSPKMGRQH